MEMELPKELKHICMSYLTAEEDINNDKLNKVGPNTKSFIKREDLNDDKAVEYLIHDNGRRPYKVSAFKYAIFVYEYYTNNYCHHKSTVDCEYGYEVCYIFKNEPLLTIDKYIGFWPGMDTHIYSDFFGTCGNSILIQETKKSYISIGLIITRFKTDEKILDYISPVENSDVPYPVAYSDKYVYFMLDDVYIKKDQLKTIATPFYAVDMYGEFYGHIHPENKKNLVKIKMKNFKILKERQMI